MLPASFSIFYRDGSLAIHQSRVDFFAPPIGPPTAAPPFSRFLSSQFSIDRWNVVRALCLRKRRRRAATILNHQCTFTCHDPGTTAASLPGVALPSASAASQLVDPWNHPSVVASFEEVRRIGGHTSCVNALAWNEEGSLLASGGDDCCLRLSAYPSYKNVAEIDTAHFGNIFAIKFVPGVPQWVLTCAGDGYLKLFDVTYPTCLLSYQPHTSYALKRMVVPPSVSWSSLAVLTAGDAGCVDQIDLREPLRFTPLQVTMSEWERSPRQALPPSYHGRNVPAVLRCRGANIFERRPTPPVSGRVERIEKKHNTIAEFKCKESTGEYVADEVHMPALCALSLARLRPEYFVMAGRLPWIWLVDRRMSSAGPVRAIKPIHMRKEVSQVTGAALSADACRCLANFHSEDIYELSFIDQSGSRRLTEELERVVSCRSAAVAAHEAAAMLHGLATPSDTRAAPLVNPVTLTADDPLQTTPTVHSPSNRAILLDEDSVVDSDGSAERDVHVEGQSSSNGISDAWSSSDSDSVSSRRSNNASAHRAFGIAQTFSTSGESCEQSFTVSQRAVPNTKYNGSVEPLVAYRGHINAVTVKDVVYLGRGEQWVASGSDDGKFYIWHRETGKLHFVSTPCDSAVLNVVEPHPWDLTLATAGIDPSVKVWKPGRPDTADWNAEKCAATERGIIDSDPSENCRLLRRMLQPSRGSQRT